MSPFTRNRNLKLEARAAMTRRQIIRLGGLTGVLAALSPNFAKAAEFLYQDEANSKVSQIMQQLSAYMAAAATRALTGRSKRESQATHSRYVCRHDFGFRPCSRPRRVGIRSRLRRKARSPPWWLPILFAAPLKRHLLTACLPIPTKPTIRTDRRARIRACPRCQPVLPRANNTPSAEHSSCAQLRWDMTLERAYR